MTLTLYRTAQEAITNVRKHAPGAPVAITLAFRTDEVALTVHNGAGPDGERPLAPTGGGYGLIGLRERAELPVECRRGPGARGSRRCAGQLGPGPRDPERCDPRRRAPDRHSPGQRRLARRCEDSGMSAIRVVVADDQTAVREGLVLLLDLLDDVEVVGAARTARRRCGWSPSTGPTSY